MRTQKEQRSERQPAPPRLRSLLAIQQLPAQLLVLLQQQATLQVLASHQWHQLQQLLKQQRFSEQPPPSSKHQQMEPQVQQHEHQQYLRTFLAPAPLYEQQQPHQLGTRLPAVGLG
jgi:hypothetical protein